MTADTLQDQLDAITAHTRLLVQPERLAITDGFIADLFSSGIESRILAVGSQAPAFELPHSPQAALTSKLTRSCDLLALGPVIINFFRGRWCPYDVTELEAWQALYPKVRSRGALLIAISPQLPRQNDFLVQQHSLSYPVLSDAGGSTADAFGLNYSVPPAMQSHFRSILVNIPFVNGDTSWRLPVPATYVISQTGIVTFAEAHADHRVRPDPEDVLRAL